MFDNISKCANNFDNLLDKQYNIVLGKTGKTYDINLTFSEYDFKHLAGFQYLTDIESVPTDSSKRLFDSILNGNINDDTLKKSDHFHKIEKRIQSLLDLEKILDSTETSYYFKYDENKDKHSRMTADFLIKQGDESIGFSAVFIAKDKDNECFYCKSIYPIEKYDPALLQSRVTLLFKEKVNIITQEGVVQFQHKNYPTNQETHTLDDLFENAEKALGELPKDLGTELVKNIDKEI